MSVTIKTLAARNVSANGKLDPKGNPDFGPDDLLHTETLKNLTTKLQGMKEVLYMHGGGLDGYEPDATIINNIALGYDPHEINMEVLSKYVEGVERDSDIDIQAAFDQFIEQHNKTLFNRILPNIELLNELNKYVNIRQRKLGNSPEVHVVDRVNTLIGETKPMLGNWLSVQNDLESRLKHEFTLSGRTTTDPSGRSMFESGYHEGADANEDIWQATHIDAVGKGTGRRKIGLETFPLQATGGAKRRTKRKAKKKPKRKAKRKAKRAPKRRTTKRKPKRKAKSKAKRKPKRRTTKRR